MWHGCAVSLGRSHESFTPSIMSSTETEDTATTARRMVPRHQSRSGTRTLTLPPLSHHVSRQDGDFPNQGPQEWNRRGDDTGVLLDLSPDEQVCRPCTLLLNAVQRPLLQHPEPHCGSGDGHDTNGEDAGESEAAFERHGLQVENERDGEDPDDKVGQEIEACAEEPKIDGVIALLRKSSVKRHHEDFKGPGIRRGIAGENGGDEHAKTGGDDDDEEDFDDAVERFADARYVVVEQEDGDLDEAKVEDVEETVNPEGEEVADDEGDEGLFALEVEHDGLAGVSRRWKDGGNEAEAYVDFSVVHEVDLIVVGDGGTPCAELGVVSNVLMNESGGFCNSRERTASPNPRRRAS